MTPKTELYALQELCERQAQQVECLLDAMQEMLRQAVIESDGYLLIEPEVAADVREVVREILIERGQAPLYDV